jgi:two-component system response regulator DesR
MSMRSEHVEQMSIGEFAGHSRLSAKALRPPMTPRTRFATRCRVIMLTTFGRAGYLRRAMGAGAVGFVVKDAPPEVFADAIRRVMRGERVVDQELAALALAAGNSPLTGRERDVLSVARSGASVAEIAVKLHLSEGTVRN